MRRHTGLLIALALLAACALPLAIGGRAALTQVFRFAPIDVAILVALAAIAALARSLKQRLLLSRLGVRLGVTASLAVSLATEAAFALTPAGAGGYPASVWLLRRVGVRLPAAIATTAADPLLDVLFFALALPLAALFAIAGSAPPAQRELALETAIVLVTVAVLAALAWRPLWRLAARGLPRLWRLPPLARRRRALMATVVSLRRALRRLRRGGWVFLLIALALTTAQWCARYAILWLILDRLGAPLSFALVVLLQALVLHVAQWTGVPAGVGGADLGLGLALAPLLPAPTLAAALLLWRLGTLVLPVVAGAVALLALGLRRDGIQSAATHETRSREILPSQLRDDGPVGARTR